MSKRISILHFLSNYIIVLLPIFTLCVMGPTEIYFGNYKELGFTYQEFGWKFLFFSFLSVFLMSPTHDYGKGFSLRASFAM